MIVDPGTQGLVDGIRPPTVVEAALQELRRRLIEGRLAPGDGIGVDQLAREFEVSALPVREAVRVLVAEGRVDHSPHRGYRVRSLEYRDVEEIYLMCRLLEGEALRRGVPRMGAEGIDRMGALLVQLEAVTDLPLWQRVAIHQDFHFVPIEAAGLARITATLRRLWEHTDHYRSLHFFHGRDESPLVYEDHHELLEACATGDGELVVALMDRHREHVLELFRSAMQPPVEVGEAS